MLKLVSDNDHPTPRYLDYHVEWGTEYFHPAEFIQSEEAQARSITQYVGDRINAFIGGILFCLVSEIALLLLKGIWS
jgi:hypothetical protein